MDSIERKGKRWTDNEDKELLEEVKNGETVDMISFKHKRTLGAVKSRIYRNIDLLIREEGRNENDVVEEYKVDMKELDVYRLNNFRQKEEEKMVEMILKDRSYEDISLEIRIPVRIIKKRLLNICKQKYAEGFRIEMIEERYKVPKDVILEYLAMDEKGKERQENEFMKEERKEERMEEGDKIPKDKMNNISVDMRCYRGGMINSKGSSSDEWIRTLNLMVVELHLKIDEMNRRLWRIEEEIENKK